MTTASTHRRRSLVVVACVLALAVGCGGGGNGSFSGGTADGGSAVIPNQPPVASFSMTGGDGLAPLAVSFDASASADADGSIVGYRWDFGDGASSTAGPSVAHTYRDTGAFTVILEVTDDAGATGMAERTVRSRGASISGVVQIAPGSSVDGDVNDRLTTPVANNSFGEAQPLRSPLRLGGFVNRPGTGVETGNFFAAGDVDDYYFVELQGGERILLSIADPSADLDLELYAAAPTPSLIDASLSTDPSEDLTVPSTPGGYFIRVLAVSGASNYVLSVGEAAPLGMGPQRAKRLSDPFVAGELLLANGRAEPLRRLHIERARGGHYRLAADRHTAAGRLAFPGFDLPPGSTASAGQLARYHTLLAAKHARISGAAEVAEVNLLRQPMRTPDDEFYSAQWHFRAIDLEAAWQISTGQDTGHAPVVVAVIDTGVLLDHPDLREQWLRDANGRVVGYDFIQDPSRAGDGDGIDDDPTDPGDASRADGSGSFHGTHVAGTIAAQSDNGIGVAGVSWGARLMPLRALGIGGGTTYDVMQAVRYAAGLSNVSGTRPPVRADIINMSLGSDFYSEVEQRTLNEVRAQGVFVVASAGNEARDVPTYPASYDGVISVAASNSAGNRAAYSNFGPLVDVAAPGGDGIDRTGDGRPDRVASTIGVGGGDQSVEFAYGLLQGTSMAAPHVAGVIALMKSIHPTLTPAQFDALLAAGRLTDDAGTPGRNDEFGWGIINARMALQAALEALGEQGASPGAIVSVSTGSLNFQAFTQELDFAVSNLGSAAVNVSVSSNQPWLTVAPTGIAADGTGRYRAEVVRAGLDDGSYAGTISIATDDDSVAGRTIQVLMLVTSPDVDADAGQHYVLLVDADDGTTAAAEIVTAQAGEYHFKILDVPPGRYLLFAGTDLNDDDFICDGGEACGAYPSLANPSILNVDARQQPVIEALSFASEFRTTATTTSTAADGSTSPDDAARGLSIGKPRDSAAPANNPGVDHEP
ncbi:MAG: S8 family serine peptidase [Pseudomonadales bacterium]